MWTNVQFTGTLGPGAPQIDWDIAVERADAAQSTYWITVKNVSAGTVNFEARYAVLS
jgi:hypothetical protein